jgi:hypothetical protein
LILSHIEPQEIKGNVGGVPRAPEELVELRSTGLVGRNQFPVEDSVLNFEIGGQLIAVSAETIKDIAASRYEMTAARLDVAEGSEPVVLELEEPFGIIEWFFPGNGNDGSSNKSAPRPTMWST